jgi:uncharacterized protein (UPF0303 family)
LWQQENPMDIAELEQQAAALVLPAFAEAEAWWLGQWLVAQAQAGKLPIAITIRTQDRILFHASMAGASPANDLWARRKSNVAFLEQKASLIVRLRLEARGATIERHGISPADYAASGGSVPICVAGVGMVATATVSGLPDVEDHALVAAGIAALKARG